MISTLLLIHTVITEKKVKFCEDRYLRFNLENDFV